MGFLTTEFEFLTLSLQFFKFKKESLFRHERLQNSFKMNLGRTQEQTLYHESDEHQQNVVKSDELHNLLLERTRAGRTFFSFITVFFSPCLWLISPINSHHINSGYILDRITTRLFSIKIKTFVLCEFFEKQKQICTVKIIGI